MAPQLSLLTLAIFELNTYYNYSREALGFWLIPAKHAVDLDRFFILFCAGSSGVDGSTATWLGTICKLRDAFSAYQIHFVKFGSISIQKLLFSLLLNYSSCFKQNTISKYF